MVSISILYSFKTCDNQRWAAEMSNSIAQLFAKNLPLIPSTKAEAFADGMLTYYSAFKTRRYEDMNYKSAPDYHIEWNFIMIVDQDEDLWMHSPQFRKVMGLAIGELFNTKITMFSSQNTVDIAYTMMFIDTYFNRWTLSLLRSETEPGKIRMCTRFPISDTKVLPLMQMSEEEMNDPAFNESKVHISVKDTTTLWHDQ